MKPPEISVVVPVYNVEKYLKQCVDSILMQTFTDIEVILVDDGSPDNCGVICDEYAKQDNRVRVVHQNNAGLSCARNAGINVSRGKYICFIDSDDSIEKNYCETLYRLLDGSEYDFSVCAVLRYTDGEQITYIEQEERIEILTNEQFLEAQFLRKSEFGVWNKLYRRELFDELQFMPHKVHEDVIWSADLANNLHNSVITTSQKLYHYRQRNSGIVAEGSKKCSPDRIFAGEYLFKMVSEKYPSLQNIAIKYAIDYPWMFVDKIFVNCTFKENKEFLKSIQRFVRIYYQQISDSGCFNKAILHRMKLLSQGKWLYLLNVYVRYIRVVFYNKILKKDAYKGSHGV